MTFSLYRIHHIQHQGFEVETVRLVMCITITIIASQLHIY